MSANPTFHRGERIGHYSLIKFLGKGGMGEVWRATEIDDQADALDVALKILIVNQDETGLSVQREILSMERVGEHPCVCRLVDAGTDFKRKLAFIALELLDGRDLADEISRAAERRLPLERAVPILLDVLDGLGHAHARGVFHRDLKPANVRVLSNGRAKVMDFGIAKLRSITREATLEVDGASKRIGTPDYMAPEQWGKEADRFGKVDGRTDLYAFGIMLFETLTGERPFLGEGMGLGLQHQDVEPPSLRDRAPGLPARLEAAYRMLVAKMKEDRFPDAASARAALEEACGPVIVGGSVRTAPAVSSSASEAATAAAIPAHAGRATAAALPPTASDQRIEAGDAPATPSLPPTEVTAPPAGASRTVAATASIPAAQAEELATAPLRPAHADAITLTLTAPEAHDLQASAQLLALQPPHALPQTFAVPAPSPPLTSRLTLRLHSPGAPAPRVLRVITGRRLVLGREAPPSTIRLEYLPAADATGRLLTQGTISARHLEIEAHARAVTVTDLSSKGTLLQDRQLPRGIATPVQTGQSLRISSGTLKLAITVHERADTGEVAAVHLARAGNGEEESYLLLVSAAPIGSEPGCVLRLPEGAGVLPHHASLVALGAGEPAGGAGAGVGIAAALGGGIEIAGRALESGDLAPVLPGMNLRCGESRLEVSA